MIPRPNSIAYVRGKVYAKMRGRDIDLYLDENKNGVADDSAVKKITLSYFTDYRDDFVINIEPRIDKMNME